MEEFRREKAPVALFAYNRLEVLKKTVDALLLNEGVEGTPLHLYVDGPKNEAQREGVEKVQHYLEGVEWPGEVTYRFSEENKGLAASIRMGVTEVAEKHGRVIVVEDDILTHRRFLAFMNDALEAYADCERVFNVNGMSIPERFLEFPEGFEESVFFSYRPTSHGWATWDSKWRRACWEEEMIVSLLNEASIRARFRRMGSDCIPMLNNAMSRKVDSWAIRWAFSLAIHNGICATPRKALSTHQPTEDGTHVKGHRELLEHEFDEQTGVYELPSELEVPLETVKSFATQYGPVLESDFQEQLCLSDLTLTEIRGGIQFVDIGGSGVLGRKWEALKSMLVPLELDIDGDDSRHLMDEGSGDVAQSISPSGIGSDHASETTSLKSLADEKGTLLKPDSQWLSRFQASELLGVVRRGGSKVETLRELVKRKGKIVDAMKMDVRGLPRSALERSDEVFDSLFYLETETGFAASYEEEIRFHELSEFFLNRGFLMFALNPNHRVRRTGPFENQAESLGQPLWCKAVWLRDLKNPLNAGFVESLDRERALRVLLLCAVEGFYDYGWEVARIFRDAGLISESEMESLSEIENWNLLVEKKKKSRSRSNLDAWDYACAAARKVKRLLRA